VKNKLSTFIVILVALSVIACSLVKPPSVNVSATQTQNDPVATQLPESAGEMATPMAPTETATATLPVITGNDPVILNAYPLDPKYYGFTNILSTPGKLWITTVTGHVLVYDPQTGQMLQELKLTDNEDHYFQGWLANDDNYVWVLLGPGKESTARSLFRITMDTGEVLPVDLPAKDTDIIGRSTDPFWTGFEVSPGKVWVGGADNLRIYDADDPTNVQVLKDNWYIQNLEWDGEYMWVAMSYCSPAIQLGILDPTYEGEPCSRPVTLADIDWIYRHEDMVWVAVLQNELNGYHIQTVLDSSFYASNPPDVTMPFHEEHSVYANPTFDGTYLWDNDTFGIVYYYDPTDMHEVGSFNFFEGEDQGAVFDLAFDGYFIWALKMDSVGDYQLVQLGLPWSQ
jgi:outer membrane protein assembly factor BamB